MKILAIETSCDETGICLLSVSAGKNPKFKVLKNTLFSQASIHAEFGGVFPNVAKKEHQKKLIPLLLKICTEKTKTPVPQNIQKKIKETLVREPELLQLFEKYVYTLRKPKIDRIAVTNGPGLEPTLWVGINFAKALSILWGVPVVPVNHMKGHFLAPLAEGEKIEFPALGLLISGGHTEIVLAKSPLSYTTLGQTVDDAAGEAYDKVARILGLAYPGGPLVAKNAEEFRILHKKGEVTKEVVLPRPMINSKDLNFSFSGLKTAVLYLTQKITHLDDEKKREIASEFEEAVKDVLVRKTENALKNKKVKSLVVGGGVSANKYIAKNLKNLAKAYGIDFVLSSKNLATDNAVMIGVAGFFAKPKPLSKIKAEGNLRI